MKIIVVQPSRFDIIKDLSFEVLRLILHNIQFN